MDVLFVFVRVISWLVLHLTGKQTIHEVTRSITKMKSWKYQMTIDKGEMENLVALLRNNK